MSKRKTTKERKEQAQEIHNNKYDYSLWPEKITANDKVIIICPIHGQFNQELRSHIIKKSGCPKCKQQKVKQTTLKNYGVENSFFSTTIQLKRKQTLLNKYGVEHPQQNQEVREKTKHTNLEKYGVEYPHQNEQVIEKTKQTNLERYGFENIKQKHISSASLSKLNDKNWLIEQHHNQKRTLTDISEELQVTDVTVGRYLHSHNIQTKHFPISTGEREVGEFIQSLGVVVDLNTRSIIYPYEIDIYLPEYNIAIEYNGENWHGDDFPEHQERDKKKQILCEQQNILLITIWENDWKNNKTIIIKHITKSLHIE